MRIINNYIIATFDYDHSKSIIETASGIAIPERYVIEEADEDANTAYGVTTDRKAINPQKVTVVDGAGLVDEGRYFVHYGAFEVCKWLSNDRVKDGRAFISVQMLLFKIEPLQCLDSTYIGEEVYGELPKTASGIYLTAQLDEIEEVKVKLTHIPKNSLLNVGDVLITIDGFQYTFDYEGKKYIKVDEKEIVGYFNKEYHPIKDNVLVEYLPDEDLKERIAENDRRRAHRDFVDKNFLHISEAYTKKIDPNFNDLPEPKTVKAKVIEGGGYKKDTILIVHRNYGCILPNKQWIINEDSILCQIEKKKSLVMNS
jgi:co-chaperonin GroES (HSP10)